MSDIRRIIPMPTPITLGGRRFLTSELRLEDVARLQAFVCARVPDPYEGAAPILEGAYVHNRAWKRLLSETIDAQASYPPEPGDEAAEEVLQSEEGLRFLIYLSLRREHPEITPEEIDELYPEISDEEHSRLIRVAWGTDPMSVMSRLVDGPSPASSRDLDWGGLWYRYITEVTGPAPQFEDLTISQYIHFRAGGSPSRGVVSGRQDWLEVALRRERFFAELDETPEDEAPVD